MTYNYDILFKYIVIGDRSTGKSSLIYRFVHSSYHQQNQPTLAAQFSHKLLRVNQMDIKIMIWDTAGQQTFRSLVRSFYKNCIVAFVVYDATKLQSYQNVQNWLKQIEQYCHQWVRVVLIANKSELQKEIVIPHFEGLRFAKEKGYDFYQVSAATNLNVQKMFLQPALKLVEDLQAKRITLVPEVAVNRFRWILAYAFPIASNLKPKKRQYTQISRAPSLLNVIADKYTLINFRQLFIQVESDVGVMDGLR